MVSKTIQELYQIGSLLYITTNVPCLAIDTNNRSLAETPAGHVENCFCQSLAKCLGISISYDHIYKKCDVCTNVNKQIIYECPFGLSNIIVPIFNGENLVAALQAGPILTMPPKEYLQTKILPMWNLRKKDEEQLTRELEAYPNGDINFVIALSEMISSLVENNKNISSEISEGNIIKETESTGDRISSIIDFITSNYAENITLTDAAKFAYVNPSHLSREFNKKMNMNFRSYLNNVRIEKAKEMLIHSDLSLAEIGNQVGFADQSYFNKIFRKQEDLTPGQYRAIHTNQKHYPTQKAPTLEKIIDLDDGDN